MSVHDYIIWLKMLFNSIKTDSIKKCNFKKLFKLKIREMV